MIKKLTLLLIIASALTGCITKKKYAALEAELNTLRTQREIEEVSKTAETKTAEEYERTLDGMQNEMREMYENMELAMQSYEAASGEAFDATKAREILQQERTEPVENNEDQAKMLKALHEQETRMRFAKQAFDKVAKNYTSGQMQVVQKGGRLVVSISSALLFSRNESELSAVGETALNRLAAAFAVQNDFRVFAMGVSETKDDQSQLIRAYQVALGLAKRAEVQGKLIMPSSIPCASSYAEFKTCDRIDLVLEQDYEAAVGNLRYEPKY